MGLCTAASRQVSADVPESNALSFVGQARMQRPLCGAGSPASFHPRVSFGFNGHACARHSSGTLWVSKKNSHSHATLVLSARREAPEAACLFGVCKDRLHDRLALLLASLPGQRLPPVKA
jgi:hypothetical protein